MVLLRLQSDERYPVLQTLPMENKGWEGFEADEDMGERGWVQEIPDELAQQFVLAERTFWETHALLRSYLNAVQRDEVAYKPVAEVARRQVERGRHRPYRRPHPERVKTSGS